MKKVFRQDIHNYQERTRFISRFSWLLHMPKTLMNIPVPGLEVL